MKVAGKIIQNRNIRENTPDDFEATYKGHVISISTDHGFGEPEYGHLKRFNIDVYVLNTGSYAVETWKDFHTIKDAIRYALEGACL